METKLWIALCALLVNLGSVYCENNGDAKGLAGPPKTGLTPNITGHEQKNSNNSNSFSSNSTQGNETISVLPKPTNDNGTDNSSGPLLVPDKTQTSTPALVSSHSISYTTSHSTLNNNTNATFTSSTSAPQTTPPSSTHTILNHFNATVPSNLSTQTGTFTPTAVPINISTAGTAPSTSSSPKPPSIHPPADTSQSSRPPEVVSRLQSTTSSTQTKIHSESPSHLNVGGSTAVAPDSPAFDPLLAGLVSAFVVTAIIITLLLFLKLRRRQSGPAFRRLQEVPMDDMEETPLYSY